ncbi:MAG: hypothetical protein WCK31_04950 [bacterium]
MKIEVSTKELKDIIELMELGYDGICEDENENILKRYEKIINKLEELI